MGFLFKEALPRLKENVTLSLREKEKKTEHHIKVTGFEPLTQGFSVFCSEQLIPHPLPLFPSVSFLHRQSALLASSGLSPSSSRTESLKGPVPAGLAGPLPKGRVRSSSLPTPRCISRKRLPAPARGAVLSSGGLYQEVLSLT
jgi:hypothetical protein